MIFLEPNKDDHDRPAPLYRMAMPKENVAVPPNKARPPSLPRGKLVKINEWLELRSSAGPGALRTFDAFVPILLITEIKLSRGVLDPYSIPFVIVAADSCDRPSFSARTYIAPPPVGHEIPRQFLSVYIRGYIIVLAVHFPFIN